MSRTLAERRTVVRPSVAAVRAALPTSASAHRSPSGERLGRIVALLEGAEGRVHAVTDLVGDDVVAIDPDSAEKGEHAPLRDGDNFVAEGSAGHDSLGQDADVVRVHRADVEGTESRRAGESDAVVLQHRQGPTAAVTVDGQTRDSRFVDMAT